MDFLIDCEGLWHISKHIFELLDYEDLNNCCEVSVKWKTFLKMENGVWTRRTAELCQELESIVNNKSVLEMFPELKEVILDYINANEKLSQLFCIVDRK